MSEQLSFNLNECVYVKLTKHGIEWLLKTDQEWRLRAGGINSIDEHGWCKYQLHDLMETFGGAMAGQCMGNTKIPFERLEVRFNKADLKEISNAPS